ncbi:MAG: hypothetical protein FWD28_10935 [Treponema sp.]|nr:hypothetical protein [Treponema sp.]
MITQQAKVKKRKLTNNAVIEEVLLNLGQIHRKYHPQENEMFDKVDDDYKRRLEKVLGITGIV